MAGVPIADYLRRHRWLIAFFLVVLAGYTVGKDMAMRDNAADRAAPQEAAQ